MNDTLAELKALLLERHTPAEAFEWLFAPNAAMSDTVPIARMEHGWDQTFELVKHLRENRDETDN